MSLTCPCDILRHRAYPWYRLDDIRHRAYRHSKAFQRCPKAPLEGFVSIYNYASYAARNTSPPPKTVGISTLELFLRLRDMLYEWLSVILRLFVLYLMFACNGDGSL